MTEQFITAKISGNELKQGSKTQCYVRAVHNCINIRFLKSAVKHTQHYDEAVHKF